MNVKLQKMSLFSVIPKLGEFFSVLDTNRARLEPWFWWASPNITPNKFMFTLFVLAYLCDTNQKRFQSIFGTEYDEQYFINIDGKFGGMIGLDNINQFDKNAEVWYFVDAEHEGKGIASQSMQIMQDYCLNNVGLNSLYAKIAQDNTRSAHFAKRNGFDAKKIEYNVRTSKRNPKITNIVTWEKTL